MSADYNEELRSFCLAFDALDITYSVGSKYTQKREIFKPQKTVWIVIIFQQCLREW